MPVFKNKSKSHSKPEFLQLDVFAALQNNFATCGKIIQARSSCCHGGSIKTEEKP
jgi:hypothetical protein